MKQALRGIIINSIAITLAGMVLPSIDYSNSFITLVIAATVLGIANTFIRPILSLILLPINIITLGIAGLFMSALILFITTLLVTQFMIVPFVVVINQQSFSIPLILSYIITATVISFISNLIRGIFGSK